MRTAVTVLPGIGSWTANLPLLCFSSPPINKSQQNLSQRLWLRSSVPALPLGAGEMVTSWPGGVKNCSWRPFGKGLLVQQGEGQ